MTKNDLINFLVARYGYKTHAAKTIVEAIFNKMIRRAHQRRISPACGLWNAQRQRTRRTHG